MTPHEHMTKHLRKVTGGIAWERRIFFTKATDLDAHDLVDAAVDIAWDSLMPNTLERPLLEIKKEGSKIVFRVKTFSLEQVLSVAA